MSITLSSTRHFVVRSVSSTCCRGVTTKNPDVVWSSPLSNSLLSSSAQYSTYGPSDNSMSRYWRKSTLIPNISTKILSSTSSIYPMMHSILGTIASNTIGHPFSITLNHPDREEFSSPSTSAIELTPTYVDTYTRKMDLAAEECGYMEVEGADDTTLPGSNGIWMISTLKRRKKKMNKHKLQKRRKKLRFKTRK